MKIVIIGGVAAGLKSAAKARRCDPQAEITVVEKGEIISYGACGMPYYVGGEIAEVEALMKSPAGALRSPVFFQNVKNIEVLTKTLATAINRHEKTVTVRNLENGQESALPYDKLVIATGASPIKPPIPGVDLGNILQLWHPDDAKAIRAGLEKGTFRKAVIIGAGLVGMEMAEAFSNWNIEATIIEMKDNIFPAFLDPEVSGIVEKYLREKGITVLTGEKVLGFTGDTVVNAVQTDKRLIAADLVLLAVGVKPNVALAKEAGITLGATGAITVDDNLRTNDPDIYAGGDCVESLNLVTGKKVFAPMGSTANKHGRVIGENLCGHTAAFRGVLNTVAVKVLDLNVGKTGISEREAKELGYNVVTVMTAGHDKPHYMKNAKLITVKLVVDADTRKVLGMQAVGEGEVAKRVDVVAAALTFGGTIDDLFDIDLSYAPPYNSPIDNVAVAANSIMNKLQGKLKGVSSVAAKSKMTDGRTVFLDVRSPEECSQIRLADCKNIKYIPLGQLRKRLDELGKEDEIVAFCKISLRGYEAAVALEGEGFKDVKVLEGGIVAWPFECEKGN
jgi:NADPH-dependent 2,4-dienoyl-CoA reductase/sulfur reductase-like enzyme/rhodanese-related sulfurtransferase